MVDLKITYSETDTKGRYVATQDGVEGELSTINVSPKLIIAFHTSVPVSMRRLGSDRALLERLISDARAKGQRIVPFCPVVRDHAQGYREELTDVIQW